MAEPALTHPADLGPVTEARFVTVFSKGALATAKDAAWALGVDVGTLSEMDVAGLVPSVPKGRLRAWTERTLRDFLIEGPQLCRSTSPRKAASGSTTSSTRVVDFTARPDRLRVVPPKR